MAIDPQQNVRRAQRHESRTTSSFKEFLRHVMAAIDVDDELIATTASATVLCLLSQRLLAGEARDLQAQLPEKVQEILSECPLHEGRPREKFGRDAFLSHVAQDLNLPPDAAEERIRGIFRVISSRVSEGEVKQAIHALPSEFWELWPESLVRAIERDDQQARVRAERGASAEETRRSR